MLRLCKRKLTASFATVSRTERSPISVFCDYPDELSAAYLSSSGGLGILGEIPAGGVRKKFSKGALEITPRTEVLGPLEVNPFGNL